MGCKTNKPLQIGSVVPSGVTTRISFVNGVSNEQGGHTFKMVVDKDKKVEFTHTFSVGYADLPVVSKTDPSDLTLDKEYQIIDEEPIKKSNGDLIEDFKGNLVLKKFK